VKFRKISFRESFRKNFRFRESFREKFCSRDGFREKFPFLRKFSTSVSDLDTHYTFRWLLNPDPHSKWKIFAKNVTKLKIFAKTFAKTKHFVKTKIFAKIFATFRKLFSQKEKKYENENFRFSPKLNMKFQVKVFWLTLRYAAQRRVDYVPTLSQKRGTKGGRVSEASNVDRLQIFILIQENYNFCRTPIQ
jgi:hypothetical protein